MAEGLVLVNIIGEEDRLYSEHFACADCGISIDELAPICSHLTHPLENVKDVMD